jgi:hypothetical protein
MANTIKPTKAKKCRTCKQAFQPRNALQVVCSPVCAQAQAVAKREKDEHAAKTEERKADAVKREKLKSRADWLREAQAEVNSFIRARDADLPCISCGRYHQGQQHAGHYLSVGARPELRFEESNIHLQCQPCNVHLSGNLILYRKALIEKIGIDQVEWLEGHHEPKKYTIDELKEIKAHYRTLTRELKATYD